MQDRLTMTGYYRYDNNVFPITYILNFGNVGHILSKTEKTTHYLPVTYAAKPEKQISIIRIAAFLFRAKSWLNSYGYVLWFKVVLCRWQSVL